MKVSVVMITYNHELFIKEAIAGIMAQKVDFEYELIIADDCSSDNTSKIINDIIVANSSNLTIRYTRHLSNKGMASNFVWAIKQAKGNYIALCEGDDYWIDPNKLQKQVDFLETNPEYSICWTNFLRLEDNKLVNNHFDEYLKGLEKGEKTIWFDNFSQPYCNFTLTSLFRNNIELSDKLVNPFIKDNFVYALCFKNGKGYVTKDITAVYRIHSGGVDSMINHFKKSYAEYTCFQTIIDLVTESRVPNMYKLLASWKWAYSHELLKTTNSKLKYRFILFRLRFKFFINKIAYQLSKI